MHMRWGSTICLFFALFAAAPALAQHDPRLNPFYGAADRLDRLIAVAAAQGGPPPLSREPEVAALLRDITATPAGTLPAFGPDDIPEATAVVSRILGILSVYLDWGIPAASVEPERSRRQFRNTVDYQAELTPLFVSTVDGAGEMMRAVTAMPAQSAMNDGQRAGLERMRTGVIDISSGLLGMIAMTELTPERRLALAEAMARNADRLSGILTISQRRQVGLAFQMLARTPLAPQTRAAVERARLSFAGNACTGLCAR
jgi:hypothetical protein